MRFNFAIGLISLLAALLIASVGEAAQGAGSAPRSAAEYLARGQATLAAQRDKEDEAPVERAIADFTKAIELDPKNVAALKARAAARGELLGDQDAAAIADLDVAIKLEPRDADAYLERGRWRLISALPESKTMALADCRKAAEFDPNNAPAFACVAEASQRLGDRARAEASYARAVSLAPQDALLRSQRAYNLLRMGRLEEALRECDASLAIDPDRCRLWRAEILRGQHRDEEARRDQKQGGRKAMELIRNNGTDAERKLVRDVLEKK